MGGKPLSAFVLAGDTTGTVLYQFLPPMLLNEVQKPQRTIEALRAELAALADRLARLETRDRH